MDGLLDNFGKIFKGICIIFYRYNESVVECCMYIENVCCFFLYLFLKI